MSLSLGLFAGPLPVALLPGPLHRLQSWFEAHGMPLLLRHCHIVAIGFLASVLLSHLGRLGGPRLFPAAFSRGKPNMPVNCGHQLVSLVHALVSGGLSLWIGAKGRWPADRLLGYSPLLGMQDALTVGYFLWDLFATLRNIQYYGPAFLLHAMVGLITFTMALSPFMLGYVPNFLLFEISTIFLNGHWFIEKLGLGTWLLAANDLMLIFSFFVIRILLGWLLVIELVQEMVLHRQALGPVYFSLLSVSVASTIALNHFWFFKIFRASFGKAWGRLSSSPSSREKND